MSKPQQTPKNLEWSWLQLTLDSFTLTSIIVSGNANLRCRKIAVLIARTQGIALGVGEERKTKVDTYGFSACQGQHGMGLLTPVFPV
jgi:hypothetical protein